MLPMETVKLIQEKACEAQAAKLLPELSGDGRKAFVQQGDQVKEFTFRRRIAATRCIRCWI